MKEDVTAHERPVGTDEAPSYRLTRFASTVLFVVFLTAFTVCLTALLIAHLLLSLLDVSVYPDVIPALLAEKTLAVAMLPA